MNNNLSYSFAAPSSDVMTMQIQKDGADITVELGANPAHSTVYLFGAYLDADQPSRIKEPLRVFVCEDETGVHAENEELTIFGFGADLNEAVNDFVSAFSSTWSGLKDVPESDLTADAIELRGRLAHYLEPA